MSNLIRGKTGDWEVVIGIEVHAQIISNSKLFSSASTKFGGDHNTQVSFIDAGMPGMLPVINWVCVEQAIKTGLGLNAKINNYSIFFALCRPNSLAKLLITMNLYSLDY